MFEPSNYALVVHAQSSHACLFVSSARRTNIRTHCRNIPSHTHTHTSPSYSASLCLYPVCHSWCRDTSTSLLPQIFSSSSRPIFLATCPPYLGITTAAGTSHSESQLLTSLARLPHALRYRLIRVANAGRHRPWTLTPTKRHLRLAHARLAWKETKTGG